jgi:hypothetical protein
VNDTPFPSKAVDESGVRPIQAAGEAALLLAIRQFPGRWSVATIRGALELPGLAKATSPEAIVPILDAIQREMAR